MSKIIVDKNKNYYKLDSKVKVYNFHVKRNCQIELLFDNFKGEIDLLIENSNCKIIFLQKNNNNFKFNINLYYSELTINGLNIALNSKIKQKITLFHSKINVNEKSYPKILNQDIQVIHRSENTFSTISCLGIGADDAKFDLSLTTKINKQCDGVQANQSLKVIALTDKVEANLKPILKINHHQVAGSHAVIFKRLNENDLYYLLTRGLSDIEAKNLIIRGNLLIDNEKYYQELEERL